MNTRVFHSVLDWHKSIRLAAGAIAMCTLYSVGWAQTTSGPSANAASSEQLQEVVVTATKTGENLNTSAVSATVVTGDELRRAGIGDAQELAMATPGIVYSDLQTRSIIFIRGVGSSFSLAGAESAVATYFDGAYIQRQAGANLALIDIADTQILRGPQSVLYGRNATGGAIVINSANPTQDFGGYFEAGGGNHEAWRAESVLNLPVNSTLAFRLVGSASGNSDWISNTGTNGKNDGEENTDYFRAKALWTPVDDFTALLSLEYLNDVNSKYALHIREPGCLGCLLFGAVPPQGFYTVAQNDRVGPFLGNGLGDHNSRTEYYSANLKLDYRIGPVTITSLSNWRYTFVPTRSDNDETEAQFFFARVDEKGPTEQEDLYLKTSFDGPFNFLAGGSYERERNTQSTTFTGTYFDSLFPGQQQYASVTSLSGYADAWFNFTPEFRFTAGFRSSSDQKELLTANDAIGALVSGVAAPFDQKKDYNYTTPHAVFSYELGGGYYYASYSQGVRTGFFTTPSFTALTPLNSERLRNWEIGAKNSFFEGRLHTDVAVFDGTFSNMIVQYNDPQSGGIRAQNAATAKLRGTDIQAMWRASSALSVNAGVSYLHNYFASYPNAAAEAYNPATGTYTAIQENLAGTPVPRAPEFTGVLGLEYEVPVYNGWILLSSLNANYTSSIDFTAGAGGPLGLDRQSGYVLANSMLQVTSPDGRFYVKGWVKNLTGKQYFADAATQAFGAEYLAGAPRTYGGTVGYKF